MEYKPKLEIGTTIIDKEYNVKGTISEFYDYYGALNYVILWQRGYETLHDCNDFDNNKSTNFNNRRFIPLITETERILYDTSNSNR